MFPGDGSAAIAVPRSIRGHRSSSRERHRSPSGAVTVLFADLVGFTTLAEARDAEEVRELLTRYFEIARVIERYGGTVEKFIGDAVMAVWGAPVAHEDDAERAVRAAPRPGRRRSGLGAGRCRWRSAGVADRRGGGHPRRDEPGHGRRRPGQHRQPPPDGRAAGHRAGRRRDPARRSARRSCSRRPVSSAQGQGGAGAGLARAARGRRSAAAAAARRGSRRRSSAATTSCACSRTCSTPQPREAGRGWCGHRARRIGKSRLAWEFLKYIDGLVETVWWHHGRCPAYGEGITFWALGGDGPWPGGPGEDETSERRRAASSRACVEERIADPEERGWVEPGSPICSGFEERTSWSRDDLFGGWRLFFERIADRGGPTVMVFEDVHWADDALLDFIDHLPNERVTIH